MKKGFKIALAVVLILATCASMFMFVTMSRLRLTKVDDYLYSARCGYIKAETAEKFLGLLNTDFTAACASVRKGNLHVRNFDWTYSEEAEFIVRCGGHGEKYASIGVASLSGVEDDFAMMRRYSPVYHILQLYTVDGINEAGLAVNTNLVPVGDVESTLGTNPGGMRLCSGIIPRYLLDNAGSVDEAVALLRAADIYSLPDEGGTFELHFMISDPEKTAVVEFVDNEMIVLYDEPIMTNFYLALDDFTEHAMGIERFDILEAGYDAVTDADSMLRLMREVWYSKSYTETDPEWLSEEYGTLVNDHGEVFGISSDVEDFRDALEEEAFLFRNRTRDGRTWHTTHTSLYDLDALTLTVIAQESGNVFTFDLWG